MKLMENYDNAIQKLYDHVGFVEDWVVYPIDNRTEMFWHIEDGDVRYAGTLEQLNSNGDYWEDEIYTQRFYDKHIYVGKELTMIMVDTHTDGNKFFAFFDNKKQIY